MKTIYNYLNRINESFVNKNINIKDNNIYCMCVTGDGFDDEKLKGFIGVYSLDNLIETNFSDGFVLSDIFEEDDENKFKGKLNSLEIGSSIEGDDGYTKVNIIKIS